MFKTYAVYDTDIPVEVLDFEALNIHGELVTSYCVRVFDEDGDDVELWVDSSQISELCMV